jgi:four helix bundle protein
LQAFKFIQKGRPIPSNDLWPAASALQHGLALATYDDHFSALPKSTEAQVLGKQVLRSGTSVGANYREACRARSKAEFTAKVGDCLKELDESSYWFELIEEINVDASASLEPLKKEFNELLAIFTTIAKKCKTA